MSLASIFVRLGLDASGYQTGLKRAESMTTAWGRTIASNLKGYLGAAFSIGVVTSATRSVLRWADSLQDLSDDLGISTSTLQEWQFAAAGTRATLDDFIKSFQFLAKQRPDLSNEDVLTLFTNTAEQFKRGELTLGQLQERLGRGASVLTGPFKNGLVRAGIAAASLNAILSNDQVKAIADVSDAWEKATLYAKGYFAQTILGITNLEHNLRTKMVSRGASGLQNIFEGFEAWRKSGFSAWGLLGMSMQSGFGAKPVPGQGDLLGPPLPPGMVPAKPSDMVTERDATSRWSGQSVNALQQVGAFIGSQPTLLTEYKEHTRLLRKIADSSDETADAWNQR
jgi:hypothetical protein